MDQRQQKESSNEISTTPTDIDKKEKNKTSKRTFSKKNYYHLI